MKMLFEQKLKLKSPGKVGELLIYPPANSPCLNCRGFPNPTLGEQRVHVIPQRQSSGKLSHKKISGSAILDSPIKAERSAFSQDLTIPHLDLSHFALCIMGN